MNISKGNCPVAILSNTSSGNDIVARLQPILFVCDLIGKAKVLKMKQCNGYYGCTLCTQRGVHIGGAHHNPHYEAFTMRSAESHKFNLQALCDGSIEKIRLEKGRKADCEARTQGVKGRSKVFDVIPGQPLTSILCISILSILCMSCF